MRKLKGYIGALIVVMALMGSILAGYALNINGTSAVINEYEKVTDVSGLYAHTDEKNYIEYNPASNYVGYERTVITYSNPVGTNTFKQIQRTTIYIDAIEGGSYKMNIDGVDFYNLPSGYLFVCNKFYVVNNNGTLLYNGYDRISSNDSAMTIIVNGTSVAVSISGGYSHTYTDVSTSLSWATENYDYTLNTAGVNNPFYVYGNYPNQILQILDNGQDVFIGTGNYAMLLRNTTPYPVDIVRDIGAVANGVNSYYVQYNTWEFFANYGTFYPITVHSTVVNDTGIDYLPSNRVNNYPIPNTNTIDTITSYQTIDISSLSGLTDYSLNNNYGYNYPMRMGSADKNGSWDSGNVIVQYNNIDYLMPQRLWDNTRVDLVNYKLSDILVAGANVPAGTTQIKIDLGSNAPVIYNLHMDNDVQNTFDLNLPAINDNNYIDYSNTLSPGIDGKVLELNNSYGKKDYLIYRLSDNIVEIYGYDGVKKRTTTADECYIASSIIPVGYNFETVSTQLGTGIRGNNGNYSTAAYYNYVNETIPSRPGASSNNYTTNMYLTYYITTGEDQKYMDITKGIKIISDPVTWNNNYENGVIKLLFRAEDTSQTYSNTLTVSGNNIAIDYTGQHYHVSLNGGAAVDVGMWRSIILDIDLINGRLTAIPVRTFNSFSNVQLDNATIRIGDLTNPVPTTSINWGWTINSLRFSVYSTEVFMNTYGVVMVNPSLNITDYFTDLNNFYRLDLYGFSVLGDSITVNNVEGTVIGDSITFGDEIYLKLKEMKVIYADGRTSVQDAHTTIDLGEIVSNIVSMEGIWYFQTDLLKGFTTNKMVYTWDWNGFIFDNVQFVIFYMGLATVGLIVGRRYATMTIVDYVVWGISILVAITVQVIG